MSVNMSHIDLLIRALLGAVLLLLPLLNIPPVWSSAFWAFGSMSVGLVLLLTAVVRFCPLYRLLGISTCRL